MQKQKLALLKVDTKRWFTLSVIVYKNVFLELVKPHQLAQRSVVTVHLNYASLKNTGCCNKNTLLYFQCPLESLVK